MTRLLIALMLLAGCARPRPSTPAPAARAYLDAAVDSLRSVALTRDAVDWSSVRAEAMRRAAGARAPHETWEAVRFLLRSLGDRHSFLQLPDSLAALEAGTGSDASTALPEPAPADPPSPSPFGTRMQPLFETIRLGEARIALVSMPQGRRDDAFAASFQDGVASLARERPCGWIVDLRGNGGGDMWPMLAGLGPLLGEGETGGSVGADGARSAWIYRGGAAIYRDSRGTEHPYARVGPPRPTLTPAPPVAVLHDRGTASSGEALAVAFRGRPGTRSFGERTWGASTATRGVRLPDGANMVVAVEVFVDRAGVRYPDGVEPDEALPAADAMPPLGEDPAVARAASWLAGRRACSGNLPPGGDGAALTPPGSPPPSRS